MDTQTDSQVPQDDPRFAAFTQAFEDWETDLRCNPANFYTPADVAAMSVATVSEARTIQFLALLRQQEPQADEEPACKWCNDTGRYRRSYGYSPEPCDFCQVASSLSSDTSAAMASGDTALPGSKSS